jgi:hypothetical protein
MPRVPNLVFERGVNGSQIEAAIRDAIKWDLMPSGLVAPLGERQRVALEYPLEEPDTGYLTGVHTGSPLHREVAMHTAPELGPDTVVSNPFSGDVKGMRLPKRIQLVSILTVDLDSPPVWHASAGWAYNPRDETYEVRMYLPWMTEKLQAELERLIPHMTRRAKVEIETPGGAFARSVHARSKLEPKELEVLKSLRVESLLI